jgi:signal transduction histidine kinase
MILRVALPRLRTVPGLLLALTVLAELGAVPLSWGLEPLWDTLLYPVSSIASVAAGALILSRHPRHAVGWLLLLPGFLTSVTSELAQGWGLRAAEQGWPAGPLAEWIATGSWLTGALPIVLVFLLFPTGRLLGPRWRAAAWLSVAGSLLAQPGWIFSSRAGEVFVDGTNPYAQPGLPTDAMFFVGFALIAVSMIAAFGSAVIRFRRSTGVERQQMKWFTLASGAMAVGLPGAGALWFVLPAVHVVPALVITAWPVAIGVAILRYRLYDVDLVISRTFTYAALTGFVAAVYAAGVVLFGAVAGRDSAWVTATATLLAAAAFGLLRRRVQDVVDRRFRPQRHDALGVVSSFVDDLRHDRAEPERVVDALRTAMRDPTLELRFVLQHGEPPVDARGRPVGVVGPGRESLPVERGGTTLGEVVWAPRSDADRALLPAVVDAASLAIEMARLRVELRKRLDEVDESRARIAAVADDERRRIERDLHDGAQQRLVSIGLALRHAQHELGVDPDEARRTLDGAVIEIGSAIGELRGLAHGLRPALLQAGLGPALRELASRAPMPVQVTAPADRYPPDLEAAAYFVACEGLTNAVKHARAALVVLEVARQDSTLVVTVADDGVGGAKLGRGSGLTGLSDRVEARGGRLRVHSTRGRGTTLSAELPCVS